MKRLLQGASFVFLAVLFATNFLLTGCGSSIESEKAAQARANSDSMAVQTQRLEAENAQLRKSNGQLEQDKKALNAKVADLTSKLGQSSQQWQDLQDLQARVNQLDSELTVQKQINRDMTARSADAERASMGTIGPVTNRDDFMRNYNEGLSLFKSRKYNEALAVFGDLSSTTVAPDMIGNAYYWTGECYYAMQKYDDAVKSFESVLNYKKSFKIGAAYIMLGMSYLHLGEKDLARTTWENLIKNDPKSQFAAKAKEFIGKL